MKRTILLLAAILYLGISSSFAQLFPKVDRPTTDDMSMLAMQFSRDKDGKYENVLHINFTGWAPAVKGPNGQEIQFRVFSAGADMTVLYYAENLPAGEYTLTGFYHVYTNYDKLDEYKKQVNNPNYSPVYEPYANNPFHVKQHIPLSKPVIVYLEPNKIMSFGSFAVKFEYFEGAAGTSADRWRVNDETSITLEEAHSDYVLRYMKPWRTPAWKRWNEKNPASAL